MTPAAIDRFPVRGKRRMLPWLPPILAAMPASAPRRFQAFAIGLPRSRTHSLAAVFAQNYRAAHEPMAGLTIDFAIKHAQGLLSPSRARLLLRARDKRLSLELEASHYLHLVVGLLPQLFPAARFILTYREPIAWFRSEINQELKTVGVRAYDRLAAYRYGRFGAVRPALEAEIVDSDRIYPFENYFRYWASHIQGVLNAVPPDQLLAIPTEDISSATGRIADFLRLDAATLNRSRSHEGRSKGYLLDPCQELPTRYLENFRELHCASVLEQLGKLKPN